MDGTDTGWVDIEKGSALDDTKGTLQYRNIGPMVQVTGFNLQLSAAATGTYALLGAVPNAYKPHTNICVFFYMGGGGYYAGYIQSNGNIYIFKGSASSIPAGTNILFTSMYFLA